MSIDTRRVANRRKLKFNSLDDLMAEAMRLGEADGAGKLTQLGNWTLGQSIGHIAGWMDYAFDGYPMQPPWFVKIIARTFMKKRMLRGPMPAGFRLPKTAGGTHATEILSTEHALDRLSHAVDRLRAAAPTQPNPVFGPLTHQEWIDLNLRHGELHLGFFIPTV